MDPGNHTLCCRVLQGVAVCGRQSVERRTNPGNHALLHRVATCCNVLQCVAVSGRQGVKQRIHPGINALSLQYCEVQISALIPISAARLFQM